MPELKLATVGLSPKDEVLKCLHKILSQIESGEIDPVELVAVLAKKSPKEEDDAVYRIYSSNLRRGTMLWMFEVGKRYCFDGDREG